MNFLFLTTKYPVAPGDTYMTSELAGELTDRGHSISVLHLNWDAEPGRKTLVLTGAHGEQIVDVAPRAIGKLNSLIYRASKFILSNIHARRELHKHLAASRFDATVSWTPALTVALPLRSVIRGGVAKHVLFVFDFFPVHHREIGLVPDGFIYRIAKALEDSVYRKFTAIICNFPSNIQYLKENYRITQETRVLSTPLWSEIAMPESEPREVVRGRYGLPQDRPIAIFGGQITEGRGIELMLEAAEFAARSQSELVFLFLGDGRLAPVAAEKAEISDNVVYMPGVNRSEYLSLLSACDIGMVATVEGVSSFSFPTKTIDYLRAGLKIVAAVEKGSDYLKLLADYDLGEAVNFSDPEDYFRIAQKLADKSGNGENGPDKIEQCLDEVFHVRHAADTLLNAVECG